MQSVQKAQAALRAMTPTGKHHHAGGGGFGASAVSSAVVAAERSATLRAACAHLEDQVEAADPEASCFSRAGTGALGFNARVEFPSALEERSPYT